MIYWLHRPIEDGGTRENRTPRMRRNMKSVGGDGLNLIQDRSSLYHGRDEARRSTETAMTHLASVKWGITRGRKDGRCHGADDRKLMRGPRIVLLSKTGCDHCIDSMPCIILTKWIFIVPYFVETVRGERNGCR